MITITINEDSAGKARQAMLALLTTGMHESVTVDAPAPPEKKSKAKSDPAKAAEPAPPAKSAEAAKETPGTLADAKSIYKPVGELILKAVGAKGRDTVVALLKKYDANMGSELKPEQYPAFMTECQALLDSQ